MTTMLQYSSYVVCFFIVVVVSAYDENSLVDDAKRAVADGVAKLPDSVKGLLPTGEVPSVIEGEELLKRQCDKYGTNESFDNAMAAKEEVQFCVRGLLNYSEIQNEIEKAKPTGDLDIVFRKYCRRSAKLRSCITNLTEAMEPCMSPDQHSMKYTVGNITDALTGFICFKEGDRIALFIAEGGPECLKDQYDGIEQCINSTFSPYIPKEAAKEQDDIPVFKFSDKECLDIMQLQKCVVGHLEKCSEPTPANIVDSLFKFVLKSTPCHKLQAASLVSAASVASLSAVLAVSLPVLLVTKQLHSN